MPPSSPHDAFPPHVGQRHPGVGLSTPVLDRLVAMTASALRADVVQISLIEGDYVFPVASVGAPAVPKPRQHSLCNLTVDHDALLCIEDLQLDPRTADLASDRYTAYRFYAGAPLRTPDGRAQGTLSILAPEPRSLTPEHREMVLHVAALLERNLASPDGDALSSTEKRARINEERLTLALESAELGLWDWHVTSGRVDFTDRWATMLGYDPDELDPSLATWEALLHPDDTDAVMKTLQEHLDGKTAIYETEHRLRAKDGSWRWIQDRGRVTERAADGSPIRAIGIHRDITQRRAWEAATREAKREAQRMNHLQSALLANINHELRTPLTAILGFSEILMTHDDPDTQDYAAMIHRGSKRLLRTFETIFDLTQIEGNDVELYREPADATVLARQTLDAFSGDADAKGLLLTLDAPSSEVSLQTDAFVVRRILSHLLSNALKFTDTGRITVAVRPERDTVIFDVRDTGHGMHPDYQDAAFDAFTQESEGIGRTYEGCGLGLHITGRLVRLLEGTIEIDSTPDVGTTVRVRLPRYAPSLSSAA